MTHDEYVNGYARLNKAYNDTFDTLQDLYDKGFSDSEISDRYNYALNILDQALDIYKGKYVSAEEPENASDKGGKKVKKVKGFQIFGGK